MQLYVEPTAENHGLSAQGFRCRRDQIRQAFDLRFAQVLSGL
jgi:hypothetical protein